MPPPILQMAQTFPSIIADPLFSYVQETKPKLKLWDICDFIELLLRFIVIAGIAQIRQRKEDLPDSILNEFKSRIEQPTLGKWLGMAMAVVKDPNVNPYLKNLVQQSLIPFIEGSKSKADNQSSLLKLRNHLAHGGSISQQVAASILQHCARLGDTPSGRGLTPVEICRIS